MLKRLSSFVLLEFSKTILKLNANYFNYCLHIQVEELKKDLNKGDKCNLFNYLLISRPKL